MSIRDGLVPVLLNDATDEPFALMTRVWFLVSAGNAIENAILQPNNSRTSPAIIWSLYGAVPLFIVRAIVPHCLL